MSQKWTKLHDLKNFTGKAGENVQARKEKTETGHYTHIKIFETARTVINCSHWQ